MDIEHSGKLELDNHGILTDLPVHEEHIPGKLSSGVSERVPTREVDGIQVLHERANAGDLGTDQVVHLADNLAHQTVHVCNTDRGPG
jgi:hypothetical protein